ncbi:MAG: RNA 2',3'-cyclic phosphodiesterase [Candidatus Omnitrophica bacterium]|nr:RNA 2',3'-cyclic phosphodiesterase [Candidatus Omnitrophota bacterium]
MPNKIRTFIALELSPEIKDELTQLQAQLKSINADVKWVKPQSMHLTLKFLGDIVQEQIEEIKKILDNAASRHASFEVSLFQVGGFPRLESPRVIWVGIDKGCSQSEAIAKELEEELERIGFEKEKRPFSAHLTLGRVRSPKERNELVSKIKALDFKPSASCIIDKITLFQSTLTPQGSIYTPLHEAKLTP